MTKQILVALIATSILAAACTTDDSESENSAAGQICTNLDSLQNEDIPDAERTSIELTKPPTVSESPEIPRLLLFTRTEGFHHDSIEQAKEFFAVQDSEGVFEVTATDETGVFTEEGLSNFDAVVFANTTGDVLDPKQQTAFENWIEAGGGYAGVHSAADTEHDWPWYGDMVGAFFESHPFLLQDATITVEITRSEPATTGCV